MGSVVEHKSCPTGDFTASETKVENRQVQNANTSCALARVRVRRTAQSARRRGMRLRATRRAGCASQDAPGARRETRRLRAGRRAGCAPEDARIARRKTCRLHAARRAGCTPLARRAGCTPEDVPRARAVRAVRAPCRRASKAGRPVWPFSSRSGFPELRGRAAGGRRHARRGPQEHRASPALLRALARLEPKPGRREVPPGFAVLFQKQEESGAKHTKKRDASVRESGARACASWPPAPGNFIA